MKVNSITTSPSFGKVLKTNKKFTDEQMAIARDIKNKMNTVYTGHFKEKTPNDWLENKGCDTLVDLGSSDKSVTLIVTSRANEDPALRPVVKQYYIVGEYSEKNPFYVNDIKEKNKQQYLLTGLFITITVSILAMIGSVVTNVDKKIAKEKIIQEKEVIVDSLKNVIKNDSIAPFKVK
ncbi:MAG: hypothetical protein MJ230_02080 [bacterium]|nr:hypothetical protein [bacterium]